MFVYLSIKLLKCLLKYTVYFMIARKTNLEMRKCVMKAEFTSIYVSSIT